VHAIQRLRSRIPDPLWETGAYLAIGGGLAVLEIALYQLFYGGHLTGAVVAKALATVIATVAAYLLHKYISFGHRTGQETHREFVLFVALNVATFLVGVAIIAFARYALGLTSVLSLQAANIFSIGVGVVLRFWGYRRFVFVD
jgi:putative flippase GtrA